MVNLIATPAARPHPEPRVTTLDDARLDRLLRRAAAGDTDAFMQFHDATCDLVWRLERCRWQSRARAEEAALRRFDLAWRRAGERRSSPLSPRAWLLALDPSPTPR